MEWHAGFDCMHTCMQAGLVVNMTLSPAIAAKIASAHDEQVRCCLWSHMNPRATAQLFCALVQLHNECFQPIIGQVTPQTLCTASQCLPIQLNLPTGPGIVSETSSAAQGWVTFQGRISSFCFSLLLTLLLQLLQVIRNIASWTYHVQEELANDEVVFEGSCLTLVRSCCCKCEFLSCET